MFTKRNYLVGLSIFVAVWVLILAVPKTRALLFSQLGIGISNSREANLTFPSSQQMKSLQSLAQNHPNDAKIQTLLIQTSSKSPQDRLAKYDELIKRFPDATWLIKDRLRDSTGGGFKMPSGAYGVFKNGQRDYIQSQNWLTIPELKETLQIISLGEKRDPKNSFYNWIEAMCWYGLSDNTKALDALQRGSRKPMYDDGALQDIKNRLYVQQLMMPVLIEDRWLAFSSELFSHYARMRDVARVASWQGGMQEKAGNNKRALEIYGAQERLSSTMFKDSKQVIGKLVASAMLQITWTSLTRKKPGDNAILSSGDRNKRNALFLNRAQEFADYANSHGRVDLAKQTMSTMNSIVRSPYTSDFSIDSYDLLVLTKLRPIGLLKWIGIELLHIILIGMALLACIFPLFILLKKGSTPTWKNKRISVSFFDVIISTSFVLLCVLSGVVFIFSRISDKNDLYLSMFTSQFVSNNAPYTMFSILTTWIPSVTFALIFICSLLPSSWKMRKISSESKDTVSSKHTKALTRFGNLLLWLAILTFQVIWGIGLSNELMNNRSSFTDYVIYALVFMPIILFLILRWYLQRPGTPRIIFSTPTFWLCFTSFLQQSLALLVLTCSLAYGVTNVMSLYPRHEATLVFDRFLDVGEVAVLQEAFTKDKSQHPNK